MSIKLCGLCISSNARIFDIGHTFSVAAVLNLNKQRSCRYLQTFCANNVYPITQKRIVNVQCSSKRHNKDVTSLFQPVDVKPCHDPDGITVGEELTGALEKGSSKCCCLFFKL